MKAAGRKAGGFLVWPSLQNRDETGAKMTRLTDPQTFRSGS
jgi:hypothetical protein